MSAENEKPGAADTANRVEIDTPEEVRGHSMSSPVASSSLVARWKSARAAAGDSRLSRVDLAAHLVILNYMNNASGEAWPSADTVAREVNATTRAIRSSRRRLVQFGYLTQTSEIGKPNHYRLGTPELQFTPDLAFTPELQSTPPLNGSSATPELQFRGPLNCSSPELAFMNQPKEPTKEPDKKLSRASRAGDQESVDESFARFWKAYPRTEKKKDAEKAWRQVKDAQHIDLILADLAKRVMGPHAWAKDDRFTPMPASYLRAERWNDEYTSTPVKPTAGRVSIPSEQQADVMNAKADAKLEKIKPRVVR